jgi:hypothetical protein
MTAEEKAHALVATRGNSDYATRLPGNRVALVACKYCKETGFVWGNIGTEGHPRWRLCELKDGEPNLAHVHACIQGKWRNKATHRCSQHTKQGEPCGVGADRERDGVWFCHVHDPDGAWQGRIRDKRDNRKAKRGLKKAAR